MGNVSSVSSEFVDYVEQVLPSTDDVVEKTFFKAGGTGQQMVFVIINEKNCFETLFLTDEKHRDKQIVRSQSCFNGEITEKKKFNNIDDAREYVARRIGKMKEKNYGTVYPFRVRNLPLQCVENPDTYLSPGDHIQRDLAKGLPASHEGIYLGKGQVAHLNPENGSADGFVLVGIGKAKASARIDSIDNFVLEKNQQLRVVVHTIERRTPSQICDIATKLVKDRYCENEYHLLQRNCQHFASLCAIGVELMTDRQPLLQKCVVVGTVVATGAIGVVAGVKLAQNAAEKSKADENNDHNVEKDQLTDN